MKRLRKMLTLTSAVGLILGGLLTSFSFRPQQAAASEIKAEKVVAPEATSAKILADENEESGGEVQNSCPVPTGGIVNDGAGEDVDFFNTEDEISANWEGFSSPGDPIVKYKYSVWKKIPGPDVKIVDLTKVDEDVISFTENAPFLVPLEEGAKYYTKVKAKNSCGWSKPAAKSDGATLDLTPPGTISLSYIQDKPFGGNVSLKWTPSGDLLSGVSEYQLIRNGVIFYNTPTNLEYYDTIHGDIVAFEYFVRVWDKAGNYTDSNKEAVTVDDVAPAAPSIFYWSGGGKIKVAWPVVAGAAGYELYRNGVLIQSGALTTFTDANIIKGQTYRYVAYAFDNAGNRSLASNTLEIYIPKPRVSSTKTSGQILGEATGAGVAQAAPSEEKIEGEKTEGEETSKPEEAAEEAKKTNWSLIIAIIIAAAIVIAGLLYWWYAREEEDEI